MNRTMAGWIVAAALVGLIAGQWGTAKAAGTVKVECKAFYQDFPNGLVGPSRALEKADELGAQVAPWLEAQFAAGATGVQLHSFVPFGGGTGSLMGGAELICVSFPAS